MRGRVGVRVRVRGRVRVHHSIDSTAGSRRGSEWARWSEARWGQLGRG